jgi:hypothetical protein
MSIASDNYELHEQYFPGCFEVQEDVLERITARTEEDKHCKLKWDEDVKQLEDKLAITKRNLVPFEKYVLLKRDQFYDEKIRVLDENNKILDEKNKILDVKHKILDEKNKILNKILNDDNNRKRKRETLQMLDTHISSMRAILHSAFLN